MNTPTTTRLGKTSMSGILCRSWPAVGCAAMTTAASAQTEQMIFSFSEEQCGDIRQQGGLADGQGRIASLANGAVQVEMRQPRDVD